MKPVLEYHKGICVVRDDLYEGGTKARIFDYLYSIHSEVVYGSAAFSKTQVSLARVANKLGRKATVFVAGRKVSTPETMRARELGAEVKEVRPGYLSVVNKAAREYAEGKEGVYLAPLGFDTPEIIEMLANIARQVEFEPEEVWCAAGSGTLSRSLQLAWPNARHFALQVGKYCDVGNATRIVSHMSLHDEFDEQDGEVPFDSDRHYDAKAWHVCEGHHDKTRNVLFWNVLGA